MTRIAAAQDKSILFVSVAKGAFFGGEWFQPFAQFIGSLNLKGISMALPRAALVQFLLLAAQFPRNLH